VISGLSLTAGREREKLKQLKAQSKSEKLWAFLFLIVFESLAENKFRVFFFITLTI